jgi:CheY-like chemotaxis protein
MTEVDASSAHEDLHLCMIHEADILITDVVSPDISAVELAQMIREKPTAYRSSLRPVAAMIRPSRSVATARRLSTLQHREVNRSD